MKPGDYGVTPGGGWPMRWVRGWTGHPPFLKPAWAGHAAIVMAVQPWSDQSGGPLVKVIEATPKRVRERVLTMGDLENWRFSDERLSDEQRRHICNTAESCLGRGYDWPSVVAVGVRVLFARFKGRASDHSDQKLFCSELVAWTYKEAGHDLFPGIAPGTVSPDALDRRIVAPLPLLGGAKA